MGRELREYASVVFEVVECVPVVLGGVWVEVEQTDDGVGGEVLVDGFEAVDVRSAFNWVFREGEELEWDVVVGEVLFIGGRESFRGVEEGFEFFC